VADAFVGHHYGSGITFIAFTESVERDSRGGCALHSFECCRRRRRCSCWAGCMWPSRRHWRIRCARNWSAQSITGWVSACWRRWTAGRFRVERGGGRAGAAFGYSAVLFLAGAVLVARVRCW